MIYKDKLPKEPHKRQTIVVLDNIELARFHSRGEPDWMKNSSIAILEYPANDDSPLLEDELYKSLCERGLMERNALLSQSPYDFSSYNNAKEINLLVQQNGLQKCHLFAGLCKELGATKLDLKRAMNTVYKRQIIAGVDTEYKVVKAKANVNKNFKGSLRSKLSIGAAFPGNPNPNIEEARRFLEKYNLLYETDFEGLLDLRDRTNKITDYNVEFSLARETKNSLNIISSINAALTFNATGEYGETVSTFEETTINIKVKFGKG
jgi:hypothetical protein